MEPLDLGATPAQPVRKMRVSIPIIIGALVLVVALAAGGAYYFYPPFKDAIHESIAASRMPTEMRETIFVKTAVGQRSVYYRAGQFGFDAVETPERTLNGTVSPDGTMQVTSVTFINGRYTNEAFGGKAINPDAWFISIHTEGAEPEGIAHGYAPAFLDGTHLAYFTNRGIVVHDLTSDLSTLIYVFQATTTLSQVQYASDRTHVLWTDAISGESVLAAITPTSVTPLGVFADLISPVLRNSGVYELYWVAEGTQLRYRSLDGAIVKQILTIPASLSILSMIP